MGTYLFAVKQRVLILHADELGPAVLLSHIVEVRELPAPHRACANVAHFTALNEVVQGFHRFLAGHVGVVSVDLEKIEVRGLQARERGVDRVEDGCAGEPTLVDVLWLFLEIGRDVWVGAGIIADETKAFRRNHDLVTGDLILARTRNNDKLKGGPRSGTYLLDELGHDAFGFTVGVEVGGIDRVDPKIPCGFDDLEGRFFVEDPRLDEDVNIRLRSHGARGAYVHSISMNQNSWLPAMMIHMYISSEVIYHVAALRMELTMGTETRRPDLPN